MKWQLTRLSPRPDGVRLFGSPGLLATWLPDALELRRVPTGHRHRSNESTGALDRVKEALFVGALLGFPAMLSAEIFIERQFLGPMVGGAALGVVPMAIAVKPLIERFGRFRSRRRRVVGAGWALVWFSAAIAAAAGANFHHPLIHAGACGWASFFTLFIPFGSAAAAWAVARRTNPRVGVVLLRRAVAVTAVAMAAVIAVSVGLRAVRPNVSFSEYVSSLSELGQLPAPDRDARHPGGPWEVVQRSPAWRIATVGDLRVLVRAAHFAIALLRSALPASEILPANLPSAQGGAMGGPYVLRRDDLRGMIFVEHTGYSITSHSSCRWVGGSPRATVRSRRTHSPSCEVRPGSSRRRPPRPRTTVRCSRLPY